MELARDPVTDELVECDLQRRGGATFCHCLESPCGRLIARNVCFLEGWVARENAA